MEEKKHVPHPLGYVRHTSKVKEWFESIKNLFVNPSSRIYAILGVVIVAVVTVTTATILPYFNTTNQQHAALVGAHCAAVGGICASKGSGQNTNDDGQQDCGQLGDCFTKQPSSGQPCADSDTWVCQPGSKYCESVVNYSNYGTCTPHVTCSYQTNKCNYQPPSAPKVSSCTYTLASSQYFKGTITWSSTIPVQKIQISTTSNFNSSVSTKYVNGAESTTIDGGFSPVPSLQSGHTYYIRACDSASCSSPSTFSYASCSAAPTPGGTCDYMINGQATLGSCQNSCSGVNLEKIPGSTSMTGLTCSTGQICCANSLLSCTSAPSSSTNIQGQCVDKSKCSLVTGQVNPTTCTPTGQVCCGLSSIITPAPPSSLPKGDMCVGKDSGGNIQVGVCFYQSPTNPNYSTNYNNSCQVQQVNPRDPVCHNVFWPPSSCTTMLTNANNGVATPGHGISDEIKNCQGNGGSGITCCALNNGSQPSIPPGADVCVGTTNSVQEVGYCLYSNGTSNPPYTTNFNNACKNPFAWFCPAPDFTCQQAGNLQDLANSSGCNHLPGGRVRCCGAPITPSTQTCIGPEGRCSVTAISGYHLDTAHTCTTPGQSCWTPNSSSSSNPPAKCTSGNCNQTCPNGDCGNNPSTPTSSCTNGQTTSFSLTVHVPGIGQGDSQNKTPKHNSRNVTLEVVDTNNNKAVKFTLPAKDYTLNSDGTISVSNVNVGSLLDCSGSYKVRVTVPGSLKVLSDQALQYGADASTNNLTATLLPGDIVDAANHQLGSDNQITIEDYNVMAACQNQTSVQFNAWGNNITIDCTNITNLLDYTDGGTQETINDAGINEWASNYNTQIRSWVTSGGQGQ